MENEAEDDIDGAFRNRGMGLLKEIKSAGKAVRRLWWWAGEGGM
jgi:hypothetical protein